VDSQSGHGRATLKRYVKKALGSVGVEIRRVGEPEPSDRAPIHYDATYDRIRVLTTGYRELLADLGDLTPFEGRLFSQNGEDGVIAEILKRVGPGGRWFVEFGAGTGGEGCCVALADVFGWEGLFMEGDPDFFSRLQAKYEGNPRVRTRMSMVTADNIEALLRDADVPRDVDVFSIDVDGNDYWVWNAIKRYSPRVLVIEYNANLPMSSMLVRSRDETRGWDSTGWFSAGLAALEALGHSKGYSLVYTDLSGVNAFFVRDDLLAATGVTQPPRRAANYRLTGGAFSVPQDPEHPWTTVESFPGQP
jgi:hypothetical protein